MLLNTHTHCDYSPDATGTLREVLDEAVRLGLSYIAMTDHLELGNEKYRKVLEVDNYYNDIMSLKSEYLKKGLYVATGVEVGWQKSTEYKAKEILEKYPFEYVINSVHQFDGANSATSYEFYSKYIEAVSNSVDAVYEYDAIGHFGFYTRYNRFDDNSMTLDKFGDKIKITLKKIADKDKILELNSRSNPDLQDAVPSLEIMKLFKQLGGKHTTFASDSHKVSAIQFNLDKTKGVALQAGFKEWTIKKDGKREIATIE